jgi:hypothetical protein
VVKVYHAQEPLELLDRGWLRVALNGRHVAGYWGGACRRRMMPQEFHRRHSEHAFLSVDN